MELRYFTKGNTNRDGDLLVWEVEVGTELEEQFAAGSHYEVADIAGSPLEEEAAPKRTSRKKAATEELSE